MLRSLYTLVLNMFMMAVLSANNFYNPHIFREGERWTHTTLSQKAFMKFGAELNLEK